MALDTLSKAIGDTIDLSVGDIIAKFGGDKRAIALAAQKGEIDPTKAVMAGMAVDRVVASAAQPQNTTVAEDALPGGLMAAQGFTDPTAQPQMGQPQMPQRPGQGLNQVPVPQRGFAGGGIVGFQPGGAVRGRLDPRVAALLQQNPGMTVPQAVKLLSRMGPAATFSAGLAATDALMSTDKGVGQAAAISSGYDYGPEVMAGGRPDIPVESVGTREQGPGFTDYLRAVGLAPREQVMDPVTGKFVDVPPKPIFQSATPGLAGVKDQTDVEKRLAEAEAGRGPDVERNSERAEVAEARRQDLLKQAAEDEIKKTAPRPGPTKEAAAKEEAEKPKTYDDYLKEVMGRMGESKVGKGMREDIEKDRAARKEAGREAMWMRVVEAGLGIMGGESPYALVNIGKGATNALRGYADDLREQKKLDREDRKILLDLEKAERAEQRDNFKLAAEMREKALDRMSAKERAMISARASMYASDRSVEAASMLKPSAAITGNISIEEAVNKELVLDRKYQDMLKKDPAAAATYKNQKIQAMQSRVGLNQMPGLNLGAWGQLTTVPGAK